MEGRPTSYSSAKLRSAKPRAGLLARGGALRLPWLAGSLRRTAVGSRSPSLTVARPRGTLTRFPILPLKSGAPEEYKELSGQAGNYHAHLDAVNEWSLQFSLSLSL